jgi:hypothetical protein
MKNLSLLIALALSSFVCVPCDAAEPTIVEHHGHWIKIERDGSCYWLWDVQSTARNGYVAGKKLTTGAINVIGCTVETAGDIIVGAGGLVVGAGDEIIRRTDCAIRCLIWKESPCGKSKILLPKKPTVEPPVEDAPELKIETGKLVRVYRIK